MQPTLLGVLVLAMSVASFAHADRLIQIAFIASIFEAAAAVQIGGFGVPLAMIPGSLLIGQVILQYLLGTRYTGERAVLWAMTPLLLLLGWALISAWMVPSLFAEEVMVRPQKEAASPWAVPLRPSMGNLTQTLYLVVNVLIAVLGALNLTRRTASYSSMLNAYLTSGYLVVFISLWQLASKLAGLPYPSDMLYSNPGWSISDNQDINGIPRLNGPFAEPSMLASFLLGLVFCCLWLNVHGQKSMRPGILLCLALLVLLLSTSTTGFVILAFGLPLALAKASAAKATRLRRRAWLTSAALFVGGACVLAAAAMFEPALLAQAGSVIDVTLNKREGESYGERTTWDQDAISAFLATAGLGVGWGSSRSSSLIPGLLANGGAVGFVLTLWLGYRIYRLVRYATLHVGSHPARFVLYSFPAALSGQIGAALISLPMITSVGFFLQLACVVGGASQLVLDQLRKADGSHAVPPTGHRPQLEPELWHNSHPSGRPTW